MEYYHWNMFNNNNNRNSARGHNGNFTTTSSTPNHATWDQFSSNHNFGTSFPSSPRVDWSINYNPNNLPQTPPNNIHPPSNPITRTTSEPHALIPHYQLTNAPDHYFKPADPAHLTCLNLGKRHYFHENANNISPPTSSVINIEDQKHLMKKGKLINPGTDHTMLVPGPGLGPVPRCKVEGCDVELVNVKEYHKRHKVCEMHAKAPKVVVLGTEQRFCQQCSRFHGVGEFDEAKRSCRRRLAGHNERRRKSSHQDLHDALLPRPPKKSYYSQDIKMMSSAAGKHPQVLINRNEFAHSLLSSSSTNSNIPWNVPVSPDLPARCSAALNELIAENRASISVYRQQQLNNSTNNHMDDFNNIYKNASSRVISSNPRFVNLHENEGHVTLDLMQDPNSTFGLLSVNDHNKSSKEDCSDLWKFPLGY